MNVAQDELTDEAFPKARRVRKRADFLRIQRTGRRVSSAHFALLVAPQQGTPGPARLGLVVTKKIGGAVTRNRIKRVCRECFRTWKGLLPPGVDLIVIAREGAGELGAAEVRAEWKRSERLLADAARKAVAKRPRTTHVSEP